MDDISRAQYLEAVKHFETGKTLIKELIKANKMRKVAVGSYIGNKELNVKKS